MSKPPHKPEVDLTLPPVVHRDTVTARLPGPVHADRFEVGCQCETTR